MLAVFCTSLRSNPGLVIKNKGRIRFHLYWVNSDPVRRIQNPATNIQNSLQCVERIFLPCSR